MKAESFTLANAFDSHVHWVATGEAIDRLDLNHLRHPHDVSILKIEPHHYRGEWIVGFAWDQNHFPGAEFPHRSHLDRVFGSRPVAFSRVDGHGYWVNTEALKRAKLWPGLGSVLEATAARKGGKIVLDKDGLPSGVLLDLAMEPITQLIPTLKEEILRSAMRRGMREFNSKGVTHIRDMSCSSEQWEEEVLLAQRGELTLAIDQYFSSEDPNNFDKAVDLALRARKEKLSQIRCQGIKMFADGALGSEGALLSQTYCSGSGRGLDLLSKNDIKNFLSKCWEKNLKIAIHAIGDEAAHRIATALSEVWETGARGVLEIEHAQVMRPDTIALLKGKRVVCHMQPCHYLSDRSWLKEKLGTLYRHAFPWRAIEESDIEIFFGSDSPIEPVNIPRTLEAIESAQTQDIAPIHSDILHHHSHPDKDWVKDTYSVWENGKLKQLVFNGRAVEINS